MQKSLIFFLAAAALVCLAFQVEAQVPLPPSHYGFRFGSDIAPVSIVMFGDLLCPQTKDQWNVLRNVLIHYGETHVKLDFTMFPLADERYSFDADRGAYVVQKLNPNNTIDAVRTWIDVVFANQDKFWDTPTYNMTASEVSVPMPSFHFSKLPSFCLLLMLGFPLLSFLNLLHSQYRMGVVCFVTPFSSF